MNDRTEAKYFRWLMSQCTPDIEANYDDLFLQLYQKEFVWVIPNDDNRIQDGLDVRKQWYENRGSIPEQGVSFLEVVIGLSRRLAFNAGGDDEIWAWQLLTNIGLDKKKGKNSRHSKMDIDEILDRVIWRTYQPNGVGGFFPLRETELDQTSVELWYQMNAYIEELPKIRA